MNRYQQLQKYMSIAIILSTALFVLYLVFAALGIGWLKWLLALVITGLCGICVAILYKSGELLKQRSLWMTTAAVAIFVCLFFSLILNYPCPNPYNG